MIGTEIMAVAWAFGIGFNACGLIASFTVPGTGRSPKWLFGVSLVSCLLALAVVLASGHGARA